MDDRRPAGLRMEAKATRSIVMICLSDTRDKTERSFLEQRPTEEQFFEQLAALEDGVALLQMQIRSLSENAKMFGNLARQMRRSISPAIPLPRQDA
jgi:hypothetical protein